MDTIISESTRERLRRNDLWADDGPRLLAAIEAAEAEMRRLRDGRDSAHAEPRDRGGSEERPGSMPKKASAEDIRAAIEAALRRRDDEACVFTDSVNGIPLVDANVTMMRGYATASGDNDEMSARGLACIVGLCIDDNGIVTDPALERDALAAEVERLRADVDRLQRDADEHDALLRRHSTILTGVANALRGDPPPLAQHSHHDLAELAAATVAERDALREMLQGRTTPPTDAEIAAHAAAGGVWRIVGELGSFTVTKRSAVLHARKNLPGARWYSLDEGYGPCAWPVVAEAQKGGA